MRTTKGIKVPKKIPKKDREYPEYFTGAVPAGLVFWGNLEDIRSILSKPPRPRPGMLDQLSEICFIGLLAYFGAFCRNHFASLVNICPELVLELKRKGRDTTVDADAIVLLRGTSFCENPENAVNRLGFLLAERYEFGTPKAVNSLYGDLLLVTPFSNDEKEQCERLLANRNLLVHHGGIYTGRYAGQTFKRRRIRQRVFFDSLVLQSKDVRAAARFLEGIANKTSIATHAALLRYMKENKISSNAGKKLAIEALLWSTDL